MAVFRFSFCFHFCAALTCLAQVPSAFAWSSKQYPLFEPVHQMAIERMLKSQVQDDGAIHMLQDQQVAVDQHQKAVESYMHAMTGIANSQDVQLERPIFIQETEDFILTNLADAIKKKKEGVKSVSMESLGRALHALEDATSPAHELFQPWSDNESWLDIARHIERERIYPDDGANGRQARLEGVVRWAYDIYSGKTPLPSHFFDANGKLQLPPAYLGH